MTTYINTKTGEYPRHIGDLENLGVDIKTTQEWAEVTIESMPKLESNQNAQLQAPVLDNGKWIAKYRVWTMTEEEIAEIEKQKEESAKLDKQLQEFNSNLGQ